MFWGAKLTSSDTETSVEVVENGPDSGIVLEGNEVGRDETAKRNDDDEGGVEPVDVEVDVLPSHRSVGDVHLLGIILGAGSERLVVGGAVREVRGRLGRRGRRRHLVERYQSGVETVVRRKTENESTTVKTKTKTN